MAASAVRIGVAIGVAGALVVAAYLIGARWGAPSPSTSTTSPSGSAPPLASSTIVALDPASIKRYRKAVFQQLEAKKAALRDKCWTPPDAGAPPQIKLLFDVTFDDKGTEIARGITEVRGQDRHEVTECVRKQNFELRIPPPGRTVQLRVGFVLP